VRRRTEIEIDGDGDRDRDIDIEIDREVLEKSERKMRWREERTDSYSLLTLCLLKG
jgi:hypothetical protein